MDDSVETVINTTSIKYLTQPQKVLQEIALDTCSGVFWPLSFQTAGFRVRKKTIVGNALF